MKDLIFKLKILFLMLASAQEEWRKHVWERDLDSRDCCSGRECCCGGATVRDIWSEVYPKQQTKGAS